MDTQGYTSWTKALDGAGQRQHTTLAGVRTKAAKWRMLAKSGVNPIKAREKERREAERNLHIRSDVALVAFESRKAELKGYWKAGRWYSPL